MRRKPKTRRHLAYQGRERYSTLYRFSHHSDERVAIRYLVNTGKQYNGHGRNTSRVQRVQRQRWNGLARVVEALPPEEGFFQKHYEMRMVPRFEG